MIVLSWIRKESYQLKTFVANRIVNPGDDFQRTMALCGNRGQSCRLRFQRNGFLKLKTCELWWNGPKFLMSNQYPQRQIPVAVITDPAARGFLTTDHVILNHGQVTWMTPELAPLSPNYHTTPMGKRFTFQQI
ncbi:hypothetical protein TNCV_475931 [Trichonephila clavipes]|nr:hypothetical protein TNCV_475931 [Trichonephila clavipes]